jgi:hypothetical protein
MNAIGVKRTYADFAGVDFMNDSTFVLPNRSPDALNVWKNYTDEQGGCIETRPGFKEIADITNKILGIYIWNPGVAIVHSGQNLVLWSNFPNTPTQGTLTTLYSSMNTAQKSVFNKFKDKLYINDGNNYLYYDGTTLGNVSDIAYVPTTTITRSPSGGGEKLQDVNLLQPKRINSFLGDGTSKDFYLDTVGINSVTKVVVNGSVLSSGYSVDTANGKVTFNTAPSAPSQSGVDNVQIEFVKTIPGYANRIQKCVRAVMWDNRIFFTGNSDYPNALFHSELNDPTYISDLSYYEDGASDSPIKDIVVGADVLWTLKYADQNNKNVFIHKKMIDDVQGAVYPVEAGNVSTGCYSNAVNYKDDILYLSRNGVEGIQTTELDSRQIIAHRSTLVDAKLINSNNYQMADFCEYKGYLLILCDGKVYLADGRQKFANQESFEYEWYYWDISSAKPNLLKEYDGELYIGSTDGKIYHFEGTNDAGDITESYWTTIMDNFGYDNKLKTTSKRGGVIRVKTIPNGLIKVARKNNKYTDYRYLTEKSLDGFDFASLDFSNLSFTTTSQSYLVFKMKEKKVNEVSLKVYSDELDKPFGLYSISLEAFVGSYIKK